MLDIQASLTPTTPTFGLGTWHLGEGSSEQTEQEAQALQTGLAANLTVIDTAEMYGDGAAESLVGQVLATVPREQVFLVSKFYPWHADQQQVQRALTASLKRLGTDYLELYLLHWRGDTPLAETVSALEKLRKTGIIHAWGVSNFDVADLEELWSVPGGQNCAANECLYNLQARGIEYDLLPWQRAHHLPFIGYSPFGSEHADFLTFKPELKDLAQAKGVSVHQLALAWVMHQGVLPIPKVSSVKHMQDNLAATQIKLSKEELTLIDQLYPAPQHKVSLAMI